MCTGYWVHGDSGSHLIADVRVYCDAAAICSLWHGLHLTAVPRSTVTATSAFVLWRKCRSSQQFYYRAMLCIRGTSHGPVSVCLSVRPSVCLSITSRCSTKTAKRRITQTTPHDSPVTLVTDAKDLREIRPGSPPTRAPNAGGVGQNRRLLTNNRLYLKNGKR